MSKLYSRKQVWRRASTRRNWYNVFDFILEEQQQQEQNPSEDGNVEKRPVSESELLRPVVNLNFHFQQRPWSTTGDLKDEEMNIDTIAKIQDGKFITTKKRDKVRFDNRVQIAFIVDRTEYIAEGNVCVCFSFSLAF